MGLPLHDWQFWVATAIVLGALGFIARPFIARKRKSTSCPGCPTASATSQSKQANITIEGRRVGSK